jgi:anti-anti-sigma factor
MNVQTVFKKNGDVYILELIGRFVGKEGEDILKEADNYLLGKDDVKLVVNLSKLEYIGSQGAATLVMLSGKYNVKIAEPVALVKETFDMFRLDAVLEIYGTLKEAIDSFNKNP